MLVAMAKQVSKVDEKRRSEVRRIFQKLYARGTAKEVLAFHEWLSENDPSLLPETVDGKNSYQLLKADLEDLIHVAKPAPSTHKKRKS
jgi:hypothetical protein